MPARLSFETGFGPSGAARRSDGPRRLLLLGDFSAASPHPRRPLAERPTLRVDIDEIDAVMARLAPALDLPQGRVDFAGLDDFHPDALWTRLPLFDALRRARQAPPATGAELLGALLGGTAAAAAPAPAPAATGLDALVRSLVAPHVVPDTRAQAQQHRLAVDAASAEPMRALLHDPAFQALESAWRGVHWLVSRLDLDEPALQLHLFDATRAELLADIVQCGGRLADSGLHHALADRWRKVPDGQPWSLVAGLYTFGGSDEDVGLLAALGLVARQAGGCFLAAADPALARAPSQAWRQLRGSEAAPSIGLVAPRLLMRRPYGGRTDPMTSFGFEELPPGPPDPAQLLWAPGVLVAAQCAATGEHGASDLPGWAYTDADGEQVLQPSAEQALTEQEGSAWLEAGLMPLMSHRHAHAVTLLRLQSVGWPPGALAGLGTGA